MKLKNNDEFLQLEISDNGKGFNIDNGHINSSKSLSGNGLKNMQMRASEMKATFTIESQANNGTHIELLVPIP